MSPAGCREGRLGELAEVPRLVLSRHWPSTYTLCGEAPACDEALATAVTAGTDEEVDGEPAGGMSAKGKPAAGDLVRSSNRIAEMRREGESDGFGRDKGTCSVCARGTSERSK